MEAVLPLSALVKLMEVSIPPRRKAAYEPETMLRLHLMQSWWSLRDDAMEDALIDSSAIRCFAGIDFAKNNIPAPPPSWRSTIL